jgi:hypothetical protein
MQSELVGHVGLRYANPTYSTFARSNALLMFRCNGKTVRSNDMEAVNNEALHQELDDDE